MKIYKYLIPLLLIVMMIFSTRSLVTQNADDTKNYNLNLKKAREYAKQGIVVDSLECYNNAINLTDSVAIRLEVADMLTKNAQNFETVQWLETSTDVFPESIKLHNKLLESYIDVNDYSKAFELCRYMQKKALVTKKTKALYQKIKYVYDLDGDKYEDAKKCGDGFYVVSHESKLLAIYKGKRMLRNQYEHIGRLSKDLFSVKKENDLFYVDDENNKRKVPPTDLKCEFLGDICENLIVIKTNGKYAYYNLDFKKKFGDYDYATNFNEGVAAVCINNEWFLIDKKGNKITKAPFNGVVINEENVAFKCGRAFVKEGERYVMVDKKGEKRSKNSYTDAYLFEDETYTAVNDSDCWTFIDRDGKRLGNEIYEGAKPFSLGVGAIKKDGRWGFIDESGKMVIENVFVDVKPFSGCGGTMVQDESGWIWLQLLKYDDE